MSDTTKIEWATHTFNPWIGCTKVSPGCANCYAEARDKRLGGGLHWGKGAPRQRTTAETWRNPVKWNKFLLVDERPRVFPSLCDWLDDEVPIEWLADFLKLIHDTTNLDWLLLTKRPENWQSRLRSVAEFWADRTCKLPTGAEPHEGWLQEWIYSKPPQNVWMGTSVEDQKRADERIPELLKIPAKVRFLSIEPLISPVDLRRWISPMGRADRLWPIVGGESGRGARPCNVEWIRSIVQQCKAAGVPCFVKQLGRRILDDGKTLPKEQGFGLEAHWLLQNGAGEVWEFQPPILGENAFKRPQNAIGFTLMHPKGGDPAEWPEDLRVREFPEVRS